MTPEQFWRTTPRQLNALSIQHTKYNSIDDEPNSKTGASDTSRIDSTPVYIDQLF